MYYAFSRHTTFDVKWSGLFDAQSPSFRHHHTNPYYQLVVALDAPVRIAANEQRYTLRTGEALLLLPWEQHIGWNNDEPQGTFYWVQFACDPTVVPFDAQRPFDLNIVHAEKAELRTNPANVAHEDMLIIPKVYLAKERFKHLYLFEQLVAEVNPPKGYYRFRQSLLLGQLLQTIASDFLEQNEQNTALPASYITYRKLVDFLHNAYTGQDLKRPLEKSMNRTYEYLSSVFRKYAGTTIVSYIQQLRVQRAKYLLLSTEMSIGEIAEDVGFEDPFYFSRVFKRIEGLSPQNYRNQSTNDASREE